MAVRVEQGIARFDEEVLIPNKVCIPVGAVTYINWQWPVQDQASTFKVGKHTLVDPSTLTSFPHTIQNMLDHGFNPLDIRWIIATHIDLDHIESADYWRKWLIRYGIKARVLVPHGATELLAVGNIQQTYADWYQKPIPKIEPDEEYDEGILHQIDDICIEAIDTAGHADTHMSLLVSNDVLIPGDAYGGLRQKEDLPRMQYALQKLRTYRFSRVVDSHTDPREKPYLKTFEFESLVTNFAISQGDLRPGFGYMWNGRN